MTREPRVLVVILNYRTAKLTLRAARAALADLPNAQSEIVLVDNASGDGSEETLRKAIETQGWADRVRLVVSPRNGGFGAGNNLGMAAGMSDGTKPDYFYILNSDAFPDRGCMRTLLTHLETHPKAGLVGSHVRGEDNVPHHTAFRFPGIASEFEAAARVGLVSRWLREHRIIVGFPTKAAQVDWVAGASVMMRRALLEQIGGFDETFFLYFEETDLCRRAADVGWQCWYAPEAQLVHIGSASTGMKTWRRRPSYWYDSQRHYHLKHRGPVGYGLLIAAHVAGVGVYRLRCALTGKRPEESHLGDLLRHALRSGKWGKKKRDTENST
jgi:N-acetylglucosaminyl-diphospho-decaprenol L-rhamnosyltransferase